MKFIDICSGIGGFRNGLEKAGHECIGYIEIDKFARKSYEAMYDTENEWFYEDITTVDSRDIPNADLWCFGFPCQDISVSGNQKGLKGEKSGIFYSIIEALKSQNTENRPEWLLIENVKNLLSINGGREFTEVLYQISEAGYDARWYTINSKYYNVPQNRERVFIIGHLRERGRPEILSQSETDRQTGEEESEVIQIIEGNQANRVYDSDGLSVTIKSQAGGGGAKTGYYAVPKVDKVLESSQHYTVVDPYGLSPTIMACDYKDPQKIVVDKGNQYNRSTNALIQGKYSEYLILKPDSVTRSLKAHDRRGSQNVAIPCKTESIKETQDPTFNDFNVTDNERGVLLYKGKEYYIRRLTPKECFRLQGFSDDDFEKAQSVCSNTQLYKQAGNAVTVNVAYEIGKELKRLEK